MVVAGLLGMGCEDGARMQLVSKCGYGMDAVVGGEAVAFASIPGVRRIWKEAAILSWCFCLFFFF